MLDRDIPPEVVEEGETDAGGDVVRLTVVVVARGGRVVTQDQGVAGAIVSSRMGWSLPLWTTTTATMATAAMVPDQVGAGGPGSDHRICPLIPIPSQKAMRMHPRGYLPLWMTYSSQQKFRRQHASSM